MAAVIWNHHMAETDVIVFTGTSTVGIVFTGTSTVGADGRAKPDTTMSLPMSLTKIAALSALLMAAVGQPDRRPGLLVYFGTYTGAKSRGIYVSRLDVSSGALSPPELAAESTSPSFLAVHPTRAFLYAVNEINDYGGNATGSVTAFAIDAATGKLTALNRQPSGGAGPAHLVVDQTGRNVLVANYGGGSAAVLPIGADGRLEPPSAIIKHTGSSVNPERQKQPHAHSINLDSDNRFAYVADLGLDKIMIYRFGAEQGSLTANDPPFAAVDPGAGPRHFAIHPNGRFGYVINELHCTITAFTRDATRGGLTALQTISTLPPGQAVERGYSTAEVQVHPSGRFLYGSNRGHNSIVVFAIDQESGKLTYLETQPTGGRIPRNFGIDPSGTYLLAANQQSDSVVVFRIDPETGRLSPTGKVLEVGAPVCVKFVPR
jgi:6-phosphogluconolactonase